jgi:hypothetical protein
MKKKTKPRKTTSRLDGPTVMEAYDKELRQHPYFKKFIERTVFENDCAAIAWRVVRQLLGEGGK